MAVNSDLMRGIAEPIILNLLNSRKMYGYEIIKFVNEKSNNAFQWKEGTLYPCLHRLESAKLIESEWQIAETGKPRKYYTLTRKGAAALAEKKEEWNVFAKSVNALLIAAV
ncbi:MAG: PadR family transcriptional regulator [Victivallaceae bacterium]|nr:PadR family transcriptional regulator [Victivallaceae bacterium]